MILSLSYDNNLFYRFIAARFAIKQGLNFRIFHRPILERAETLTTICICLYT